MRLWFALLGCLWSVSAQAGVAERFGIRCASLQPQTNRSVRIYAIQNGTVGEWHGGDSLFNLCRSRECRVRVSRKQIYLASANGYGGFRGIGAVRRETRFNLNRRTGHLELVEAASAIAAQGRRVDLTRSRFLFVCRQVALPQMALK